MNFLAVFVFVIWAVVAANSKIMDNAVPGLERAVPTQEQNTPGQDQRITSNPPWCSTLGFTASWPAGFPCNCNKECASNHCSRGKCVCDGFCVCFGDVDCEHGYKCINKPSGSSTCGKVDLPIGSDCSEDGQCDTGQCNFGRCACNNDSHCPPEHKCFKPLLARNYCQVLNLPLGANCRRNEQCESNHCNWRRCACKRSHHCPSGKRCKRRLGRNKCV